MFPRVIVAEVVSHSTLIKSSLAVERTLYEAPYPAGTAVWDVRRWQRVPPAGGVGVGDIVSL